MAVCPREGEGPPFCLPPPPPPPAGGGQQEGAGFLLPGEGGGGRGGCDADPQRLEGGDTPTPPPAPPGQLPRALCETPLSVGPPLRGQRCQSVPGRTEGGPPVPPPQGGRRQDRAGPGPAPGLSRRPSRAPAQPAGTRGTRGRTERRVAPGGESFLQRRTLVCGSSLGAAWGRCPAVTATGSRSPRRAAPEPARPAAQRSGAERQVSAPGALPRQGHAGAAEIASLAGRFEGGGTERSAPSPRGAAPEPARPAAQRSAAQRSGAERQVPAQGPRHPHPFPKRPGERRGQSGQREPGAAVGGEGRRAPARSRGEFGRGHHPRRRSLATVAPRRKPRPLRSPEGMWRPRESSQKARSLRACQSLALGRDGKSGNSPVRWDRADDLLSPLAELREAAGR
ncbi:collagen alpha-1(I) chain-like [Aquila chrysaetos chrysaetos]|uniref:collagen alpha-1(I) chain-like n=1 Tax=Aquila chrysaetos chrysaetos TaxID=223781 RepID=UPI0011771BC3|nr:collagen alpha-1(I) chain-like [Aquila chrysaetos chrysaetos]